MVVSQKKRPNDLLTLNFSGVQKPYPNGMLPIISVVNYYTSRGYKMRIIPPNDANVNRLFKSTNWAQYLNNKVPKSESLNDRHLATRQFNDFSEVHVIVKDFMDVVLRNIPMPEDVIKLLSGL